MTDDMHRQDAGGGSSSDTHSSSPSSTMKVHNERHPALYYADGNVILSGRTQNGEREYFRVHQSILSRHSPVLADMFSIPPLLATGSRTQLAESYDGAVHVQMPDTAEELTSFLTMFYDPL